MEEEFLSNPRYTERPLNRIDTILSYLESYWKQHPNLRLGQLLTNIGAIYGHPYDIFYLEDKYILEFFEEIKRKENTDER